MHKRVLIGEHLPVDYSPWRGKRDYLSTTQGSRFDFVFQSEEGHQEIQPEIQFQSWFRSQKDDAKNSIQVAPKRSIIFSTCLAK